MKYIIIIIASLAFFACRMSKQSVSQKAKTVDSSTVKVFKKESVTKTDSVSRRTSDKKKRIVSDSGYSKTTSITELYSDEFDFDNSAENHEGTQPGTNPKRTILRRNIEIFETGIVNRSQDEDNQTEKNVRVETLGASVIADSSAHTVVKTESERMKIKKVFVFQWWWLWFFLIILAVGYCINEKFNVWQNLKRLF